MPRLVVGVFGAFAVGVFFAQQRSGGLVEMPGGFGSGVFDVARITVGCGLEGAHPDPLAVFVVVVEERLHAVAPGGALLASGGAGDVLLFAVGVDNSGEASGGGA
jgi:hypothetical protein